MNEQTSGTEGGQAAAATPRSGQSGQTKQRAVSDPREVVSLAMARMNLVNAKKDELAMAITGLVDMAQQLTRVYGEQLLVIEQLRRRVKALEAAAGARGPAAADTPPLQ